MGIWSLNSLLRRSQKERISSPQYPLSLEQGILRNQSHYFIIREGYEKRSCLGKPFCYGLFSTAEWGKKDPIWVLLPQSGGKKGASPLQSPLFKPVFPFSWTRLDKASLRWGAGPLTLVVRHHLHPSFYYPYPMPIGYFTYSDRSLCDLSTFLVAWEFSCDNGGIQFPPFHVNSLFD